MRLLNDVLAELTARHADSPAVGDSGRVLTYRELADAATAFGTAIDSWWRSDGAANRAAEHGGRARAGICAANSAGYVVAYAGLLRAGMVPFLLDPALGAHELAAVTADCGIDLYVSDRTLPLGLPDAVTTEIGGMRVTAMPARPPRPELLDTTEVCRFTSGSTGSPRCIEFSGAAVLGAALSWREATGLGAGERVLCFAGLFNGLAFNTSLLATFLAGASLWVPSGLPSSGHVVRFLREIEPTRLTGFPALYESLLRRDQSVPELAGLRSALSSAAPLSPRTAAELRRRHGLAVCDYYGVAEAGPLTYDPDPAPGRGLGYPLPGVEFAFGAPGHSDTSVRVRSRSMGSRYLNAAGLLESRLDAEGFYLTGDEGLIEDGRLVLRGRTGKGINIGGRKIDPVEVQEALRRCGAADALVLATVKKNGDPVLVALVDGVQGAAERELRARCLGLLAAHKVPERIFTVPRLPRGGAGKPRLGAAQALVADLIQQHENDALRERPGTHRAERPTATPEAEPSFRPTTPPQPNPGELDARIPAAPPAHRRTRRRSE
ncbi:class I adenylate-forming enzyme family protein [Streptomyces sp. YIM B13518]|uniref:class I adenylate-forming enzyme family protein n=1 Tax=Streptomyces sp. YIM B13518 TaxID=3366316 RepID=UPI0036C449AD